MVAGTSSVTCSFNSLLIASFFFGPNASRIILLAFKILANPIETACLGTSVSLSKNRLFAFMVLSVKFTTCVSLLKSVPGSLKPM